MGLKWLKPRAGALLCPLSAEADDVCFITPQYLRVEFQSGVSLKTAKAVAPRCYAMLACPVARFARSWLSAACGAIFDILRQPFGLITLAVWRFTQKRDYATFAQLRQNKTPQQGLLSLAGSRICQWRCVLTPSRPHLLRVLVLCAYGVLDYLLHGVSQHKSVKYIRRSRPGFRFLRESVGKINLRDM